MRILHVVPSYYPATRYGGPIRSVHGLARALVRRGHDVHVYTTNVDGLSNADVQLDTPVNLDGVSVWYFPTSAGRRLYRSNKMAKALAKSMIGFDVVHIHSAFLWPTTAAARTARAFRVPYVLAPRGMLVSDLIRRNSWLAKRVWIALFERHNLAEAAAVHVTSTTEADDINQLGLKYRRVIVVANGVDVPAGISNGHESLAGIGLSVLFVGRITWKKGLDRLIAALAFLPEVNLVVVGGDDEGYRATLEGLAGDLGVISRVHFLGPVDDIQKWALIASARVLALPSYSENFGNVIVEAMAVGCPVVLTPEVGLADIVRQSGAGLVVPGDPKSLAAALQSVLSDPNNAQAMGQAGQRTVEKYFTWSVVARDMEQAYSQITSSRAPCS